MRVHAFDAEGSSATAKGRRGGFFDVDEVSSPNHGPSGFRKGKLKAGARNPFNRSLKQSLSLSRSLFLSLPQVRHLSSLQASKLVSGNLESRDEPGSQVSAAS